MSTTSSGVLPSRSERGIVYLLLATAFLIGLMFAIATPMWQTPDEPNHLAYIETIANEYRAPRINEPVPADIDASLRTTNFWPQLISTVQWTGDLHLINTAAAHPPVYYAVCAPVFRLAEPWGLRGQLFAVRFLGVLAAVAIVWLAFLTASEIFPDKTFIKLMTPALIALQPMFLFIMAGANNDVLVNLLSALTLYFLTLVVIRGFSWQRAVILGVLVGLGIATKASFLIMIPVVLFGFLVRAVLQRSLKPALIPTGLWLITLAVSGGWVFFTDGKVFGGVVSGLAMPGGKVTSWTVFLQQETLVNFFIKKIPVQFWGDFGWLAIPMNWNIYLLTFVLSGLALAGTLVWLVRHGKRTKELSRVYGSLLVHGAVILATVIAIMRFELASGGGSQGRYLFGVIISIFLFFALGWDALCPPGGKRYLMFAIVAGFFSLCMIALFKYMIPYFYVV